MARSGSGRRGAYRSNRLSLSMAKCGRNSETTRLIASLHDQGKWFTAALSHQFDLPARAAYPRHGEACGWRNAYPPTGPCGRWLGIRVGLARPRSAQQ